LEFKHSSSFTAITFILAAFAPCIAGNISSNTKQSFGLIPNLLAANKYTSGQSLPLETSSVVVIESKYS